MKSKNKKNSDNIPFILFLKIIYSLNKNRRKQLLLVLILMSISSLAEIFSIALIIPFLNLIIDPNSLGNYPILSNLINVLASFLNQNQLFVCTLIFCLGAIFSGILRLTNLRVNTLFGASLGIEISEKVLRVNLSKEYPYFLKKNSSYIVALATTYAGNAESFLFAGLQASTNIILTLFFISTLMIVSWKISLISFLILGCFYLIIILKSQGLLYSMSKKIANSQKEEIKVIQESIGGIRDIILDSTREKYLFKFYKVVIQLKKTIALQKFISAYPRYLVESVIICFVGIIAYIFSARNILIDSISTLGFCALASQKILPSIQQIYGNYSIMNARIKGVKEVLKTIKNIRNVNNDYKISKIKFKHKLELKNLGFKYESRKSNTLNDISLTIHKGERVGILGTTGSGKSTLLDIIISLLEPNNGLIKIDDTVVFNSERKDIDKSLILGWRSLIAYVPQSIFLTDASIKENIAFIDNLQNINIENVKNCAEQASLSGFIESLPQGYDTLVGERGFQLSGGQIQRLGIARALYKKCPILVLDEATSALDNNTEQKIIESINSLSKDLTIITVAHRLSTLKNYDKILILEEGSISRICKPNEIL